MPECAKTDLAVSAKHRQATCGFAPIEENGSGQVRGLVEAVLISLLDRLPTAVLH